VAGEHWKLLWDSSHEGCGKGFRAKGEEGKGEESRDNNEVTARLRKGCRENSARNFTSARKETGENGRGRRGDQRLE